MGPSATLAGSEEPQVIRRTHSEFTAGEVKPRSGSPVTARVAAAVAAAASAVYGQGEAGGVRSTPRSLSSTAAEQDRVVLRSAAAGGDRGSEDSAPADVGVVEARKALRQLYLRHHQDLQQQHLGNTRIVCDGRNVKNSGRLSSGQLEMERDDYSFMFARAREERKQGRTAAIVSYGF